MANEAKWGVMHETRAGLEWYPTGWLTLDQAIKKGRSCLRVLEFVDLDAAEKIFLVVQTDDGALECFPLRSFPQTASAA